MMLTLPEAALKDAKDVMLRYKAKADEMGESTSKLAMLFEMTLRGVGRKEYGDDFDTNPELEWDAEWTVDELEAAGIDPTRFEGVCGMPTVEYTLGLEVLGRDEILAIAEELAA